MIDTKTLAELEHACQAALDIAKAYRDAIKDQAEQNDLDPVALRRYVTARVRDRLAKLEVEKDTLEQLTLAFDVPPELRVVSGSPAS